MTIHRVFLRMIVDEVRDIDAAGYAEAVTQLVAEMRERTPSSYLPGQISMDIMDLRIPDAPTLPGGAGA